MDFYYKLFMHSTHVLSAYYVLGIIQGIEQHKVGSIFNFMNLYPSKLPQNYLNLKAIYLKTNLLH